MGPMGLVAMRWFLVRRFEGPMDPFAFSDGWDVSACHGY